MFTDSHITHLSPYTAFEEATTIPIEIMPVYIGSGNCVIGLDASGLQGIGHGVVDSFRCFPNTGGLYIVKHGMVSDVLEKDCQSPLGWLDWELEYRGKTINAASISKHGGVWSRLLSLDQSTAAVEMLIDSDMKLRMEVSIPFGTSAVIIRISLEGYFNSGGPCKETYDASMKVRLNLLGREGQKLYHDLTYDGSLLHGRIDGHEVYNVDISALCSDNHALEYGGDQLVSCWTTEVSANISQAVFAFGFNEPSNIEALLKLDTGSRAGWIEYFKGMTAVKGLDCKEEYLYNMSLYLYRAAFLPEMGFSIGSPFYCPWCWRASTFWDSNQVMDSIMRIGNREAARKFMELLKNTMKPKGRVFPWMFLYDGTSSIEEARDLAPLAIAAHATTAIKYFEYYGDMGELATLVYPVVKACADYALDNLIGKVDGRWILSAAVSNDVVVDAATEINQTHTMAWFLVVLKKAAEFASILGKQAELHPDHNNVLEGYQLETADGEYLHSRGVTAAVHDAASWIPFLLYPTEAMPFVDMELYDKTRMKYCFRDLYMEKQGSYQPWPEFMQASSDYRRGAKEEGFDLYRCGMEHAYGCGYFSEIGPRQETVGLPPYISAHGSFVSALLYQFVSTDIWKKEIGVFTSMPHFYEGRTISVGPVTCAGNIKIKAFRNDYELHVDIEGDASEALFTMLAPRYAHEKNMRVMLDGVAARFEFDRSTRVIKVRPGRTVSGIIVR